ncbi:MAG: hypothetical protein NW206_19955 [Hyphomonadaceae bacterium]|nr:hypothetical protein [Hyphomonadaceae bacterium]
MTKDEVRAFLIEQLTRLAREALAAIQVGDYNHASMLFFLEHGVSNVVEPLGDSIRLPSIGKPAARRFVNSLADKMTFDVCARLAPEQRTLVAILDAANIPRSSK